MVLSRRLRGKARKEITRQSDSNLSVQPRAVSVLTMAVTVASSGEAASEPPFSDDFKRSDEQPRRRPLPFPPAYYRELQRDICIARGEHRVRPGRTAAIKQRSVQFDFSLANFLCR